MSIRTSLCLQDAQEEVILTAMFDTFMACLACSRPNKSSSLNCKRTTVCKLAKYSE